MFVLEELGDGFPPLRDVLSLTPQGDLVASLRDMPAGTGLAVQLAGLDFAALSEAQLLEAARAWERQERWLAARRNELCAALRSAPGPQWAGQPAASCPEEWDDLVIAARDRSMAASIGLSPYAAAERGDAAQQLAFGGRLAATGRALAAGLVPEASARLIAIRLRDHNDALAASVEAAVLPRAQALTHRKLERVLSREIAVQRAALGVLDNEVARAERRVTRPRPGEFGTASLQVVGPAEDIQVLHIALTALAEATKTAARAPGDDQDGGTALGQVEGLDAYRFDALISLACAALDDDRLPTHHGRRPSIAVTVPAAVLLGLSQAPAELEGHGPISAAAARRLAMDPSATWRRVLTDPTGLVLDYSTSTYRPPRHLSDLIITRDRTCAFDGRPVRRGARSAERSHRLDRPPRHQLHEAA